MMVIIPSGALKFPLTIHLRNSFDILDYYPAYLVINVRVRVCVCVSVCADKMDGVLLSLQ